MEHIEYSGHIYEFVDLKGSPAHQLVWHNYFAGATAIFFVIKCNDRVHDAKQALFEKVLSFHVQQKNSHHLKLVIFITHEDECNHGSINSASSNYQVDSEQCLSLNNLKIEINTFLQVHQELLSWTIIKCNAKSGEGVEKGMNWLHSQLYH